MKEKEIEEYEHRWDDSNSNLIDNIKEMIKLDKENNRGIPRIHQKKRFYDFLVRMWGKKFVEEQYKLNGINLKLK